MFHPHISSYMQTCSCGSHMGSCGSHMRSCGSHMRSCGSHMRSCGSHMRSCGSHMRSCGSHMRSCGSHMRSCGSHMRSCGSHMYLWLPLWLNSSGCSNDKKQLLQYNIRNNKEQSKSSRVTFEISCWVDL